MSCQFVFHNPKGNVTQLHYTQLNNIPIRICNVCLPVLLNYRQGDPTMAILYRWSEECGSCPSLPDSLCDDYALSADLAYYLDTELNRLRKINPNFPIILIHQSEKDNFLEWIKHDKKIMSSLYDVEGDKERENIMLRLWVGLKEAAKTIRKDYITIQASEQGDAITQDYSAEDRKRDFTKIVDPKAISDIIYANGVEAAPYHELVKMNQERVYLQGVPLTSKIWRYIEYKGKCIVTLSDIKQS